MDDSSLWDRYLEDPSDKNRNVLMVQYLPLVQGAAKRSMKYKPKNVLVEDMESYGLFGLIEAIEKFDPELGFKFSTFALKRINGAMMDELRKQDWLPRRVRSLAKKIEKTRMDLLAESGRHPTDQEIATVLEIEVDEIQKTLAEVYNGTATSLDPAAESMTESWQQNTNGLDYQRDRVEVDQYQNLELTETIDAMVDLIDLLPEKEKIVFTLYYYEDLPLSEIGKLLNVTQSRACQILTKSTLHCASVLNQLA